MSLMLMGWWCDVREMLYEKGLLFAKSRAHDGIDDEIACLLLSKGGS